MRPLAQAWNPFHHSFSCLMDSGFALRAPRNDDEIVTRHWTVVPREGGVSSTLRLIGSITAASGILGHPPSRVTTSEYGVSFSRRDLRPRLTSVTLENRGRREDRVLAAPAVSRAIAHRKRAHEHTGSAETLRPSLRSGFTAYFVLSPVNGSFATVAAQGVSLCATWRQHRGVRTTRLRRTLHARSPFAQSASTASHRAFV